MGELLAYIRSGVPASLLVLLLAIHILTLLYARLGGRRAVRTAALHLAAFDWALAVGVTAGYRVTSQPSSAWPSDPVTWGLMGVIFLFLPTWLLVRFGIRLSGMLLLPVMPTDRTQRTLAGRALQAYGWGLNNHFFREDDGELHRVVKAGNRLQTWGPGLVMTSSHYAVPLTVGTRDTRVEGLGLVFTRRGERPRTLVDLRTQARSTLVHGLTRDGIPVIVPMTVEFQIDRRGASGDGLHPFDPEAVFAAVHAQGVNSQQETSTEQSWDQIVVDRAVDLLQGAIARTPLAQLLESNEYDRLPPWRSLGAAIKQELVEALEIHGIQVLDIGLGNVEVEDEAVIKQRAEAWKANWEQRRLERGAQRNAQTIRLIEEARVDAQRQMVAGITEALQQQENADTPVPARAIAQRFIDALEAVAASSPLRDLAPEAVSDFQSQLRLLVERSGSGDGAPETQPTGETQ